VPADRAVAALVFSAFSARLALRRTAISGLRDYTVMTAVTPLRRHPRSFLSIFAAGFVRTSSARRLLRSEDVLPVSWSLSSWSGTARRLSVGFGALVLSFGIASYFALAGLGRIHGATARMKGEEAGVRAALELASAVRDQYAHQAHTIIIGNESHLAFYAQAEKHVLALTRELRSHTAAPEARVAMDDIEAASAELDAIFRGRIVPAVVREDSELVRSEHARAQLVVTRIQDRAEELVGLFESSIAAARTEVDAVERRTYRWIVALLVGAPILAFAVALAIGRSIGRPLSRLQAGAARLAQGDLDTRIEIDTPDEFGAVARQFNAMTTALKEHQDKLVQSEKLAGVGRLAAGVAHEINNPLGVILGYTRLLQKQAHPPLADDLAVIEEETIRCKEIVEGLLDLSRPLNVSHETVDLRATVDEVVDRLRDAGSLRTVEVRVTGAASTEGHASKLRQVFANVTRNAAEAAGDGGSVEIVLSEDVTSTSVAVHDSGPGLEPAVLSRLFEPFFTTKEKGTGLGLAISRAIARAHGGDIEAANGPAGGALITIHLPRHTQEVAA
jgi:signal transduction histidine kinase